MTNDAYTCSECPYYTTCAERVATGSIPPYRPGADCRRTHVIQATLFDGRHETPARITTTFWHGGVPDVMDFFSLETFANKWVREHFEGKPGLLVLYVTGLSQALLAVVKACYRYGVHLTCMHHDRETDTYRKQIVF